MEENTHKVVVCTGSGRHGGLGEAILLRFASEGYHVVVTDIGDTGDRHLASSSDMESVAAGLKSKGADVLCLPCDVRSPDSVAALFGGVIAEADSTKINVTGSMPINCPGTPGQKSMGRKAQRVVAVEETMGQNMRLAASP